MLVMPSQPAGGLGGAGAAKGWRSSFGAWDSDELAALQELVLSHAALSHAARWPKVARALGTGRSKGSCTTAWRKVLKKPPLAAPVQRPAQPSASAAARAVEEPWTAAEIAVLGQLVVRLGVGDWGTKACVLFRSPVAVAAAWERHREAIVAVHPQIDELESIVCQVCGDGGDEDKIVLCDGCPGAYHIHCLAPRLVTIPSGDWHCPECSPHPDRAAPSPASSGAPEQRGKSPKLNASTKPRKLQQTGKKRPRQRRTRQQPDPEREPQSDGSEEFLVQSRCEEITDCKRIQQTFLMLAVDQPACPPARLPACPPARLPANRF